jgi:hypothetical protein
MLYLALGVVAFLLFGWVWQRSAVIRKGGWRVGAGLLAVSLILVGGIMLVREEWYGLVPVLGGLLSAVFARMNRGQPASSRQHNPYRRPRDDIPPRSPPREGMSAADARSILGVAPGASTEDIRAAYTRLMQRAHPDKGGTTGLAAQLNAARDRLLKG